MPDSTLTLISHPLCPFVQRAAIVLLEKGVPFERINVDLAAKPDWFLALSPTGKVPLLKVVRADREDAVLFESMVICEYLEETQAGGKLYAEDALSRAQQRAWIEFGTATLADAWQFLNASDRTTSDDKRAAFRKKLQQLEKAVAAEPYFSGSTFSMVDAVYAPLFRYFDILDPKVSQPIFEGLPRVKAWRAALGARESVIAAVGEDYAERFGQHLRLHQALLAN
ncbi:MULTISPECIES: glutathione S-transferase family protein [Ralstonia solanacearum species complex]|uniref:glutathione transferase n=1 Tax=Ralstonia nicotianae (strain ATCC BAA-1114 / GMI1000) TaxID=267608 RepID=Q8XW81_RALN1|nr:MULTISPECIES: glutathione S-transferase family protein [Ralstonia solanacearum species complex]AST28105.1 glutathione S-transferase [Ralstonia pseudosolanacearum]MCL9824955.1 glutathione S-transferase family protein [Ralstonia solanacearum]MCL9828483.1 glutathione S-transferase family protein [Ralstonia solanacearum]MCL9833264.1 glutathione S-transferase family protein [Ralstonia solanacearum]MCQ4681875.1 glutathione S-transferase family protein [Ralstonia pseudosolanacearum]